MIILIWYSIAQNKIDIVAEVCEWSDILSFLKPYFCLFEIKSFFCTGKFEEKTNSVQCL